MKITFLNLFAILFVLVFVIIALSGCLTAVPKAAVVEKYRVYEGSYNKVWSTIITVLQNENLELRIVDKESGLINAIKNRIPSTADMLMHYSTRYLVNIAVQPIETERNKHRVRVAIRSKEERKYKERGWRPGREATGYSEELYNKITANLSQ